MTTVTYPFFSDWNRTCTLPDFKAIKADMFMPAFEQAMKEHRAEVDAILNNPAPATFDNTLVPLELAGENLERVNAIFAILSSTRSTKKLQKIEEKLSPLLSRHYTEISLLPKLFERIDAVYAQREALAPEARRLVEEKHRGLVLGGAKLPPADKQKLIEVTAQATELQTRFANNLMNEVDEQPFVIASADELVGLSADTLARLKEDANKKKLAGYAIKLQRDAVESALERCSNRTTRQRLHTAFINRCNNGGKTDNKALIPQILQLRAQEASILGFESFAHAATVSNMARTPDAALSLMRDLWAPAKSKMAMEQRELEEAAKADGLNEPLQAWDWVYYAEKVRQQKYALDEAELKPYFSMNAVRKAAFSTAEKLFGIKFKPRKLKGWHPDVKAFDVLDKASGAPVALFLTDYYARDGKLSGAWMSEFAGRHKLNGGRLPIVYNVGNFPKPAKGQPALLTMDAANTLFHELGHGLHGMLSQATYPSLAGTNVYADFVELPSQLFEHWLTEPKVMKRYLKHVETGAPIPDALIEKIVKAQQFGEGFQTVRALSSAMLDLELHSQPVSADFDIMKVEADFRARYAMPEIGEFMHRPTHFGHLFNSSYYAAGYYVYTWASVLDHDVFAAFEEKKNPFHKKTAEKLLTHIYSAGNTQHPADLFKAFRGRDPKRDALLRNKGLNGDKAA